MVVYILNSFLKFLLLIFSSTPAKNVENKSNTDVKKGPVIPNHKQKLQAISLNPHQMVIPHCLFIESLNYEYDSLCLICNVELRLLYYFDCNDEANKFLLAKYLSPLSQLLSKLTKVCT